MSSPSHNCGTVARITYTVLVETLNPAQSINQSINQSITTVAHLNYEYETIMPKRLKL